MFSHFDALAPWPILNLWSALISPDILAIVVFFLYTKWLSSPVAGDDLSLAGHKEAVAFRVIGILAPHFLVQTEKLRYFRAGVCAIARSDLRQAVLLAARRRPAAVGRNTRLALLYQDKAGPAQLSYRRSNAHARAYIGDCSDLGQR